MPIVDLSNWCFSFGGDARLLGTELYNPPEILRFATGVELLQHLADGSTQQSGFQIRIQKRLQADPNANQWHKLRTRLGVAPHFKSYRRNTTYQQYHDAAIAVAAGNATTIQQGMVQGLNSEIAASQVVVPAGQVLFHGCADRELESSVPYSSFISTSLDPTVCIYHALKRQQQLGPSSRATVYVLTSDVALRAMWGNGGSLEEWEVLLQSSLTCTVINVHRQGSFDIVEATIRP